MTIAGYFQRLTEYQMPKLGRVIVVKNDKPRDRGNDGLIGNSVEIDGIIYKVRGIESFALSHIREGAEIGLLVEPLHDEK